MGDVPGATSTTCAFAVTAAAHGNWFRAVFTNSEGSATTATATLTVRSVSGSDFDGDAMTDIAVYRRTTGIWYVGNDSRSSTAAPATSRWRGTTTATARPTSRSIGRLPASGTCAASSGGSSATPATSRARGLQRRRHDRHRRLPAVHRRLVRAESARDVRYRRSTATFRCPRTTTATARPTSRSTGRPPAFVVRARP